MAQRTLSDTELHAFLYKVVGEWRIEQLSSLRRQTMFLQDKIDELDNRSATPKPNADERRAQLQEKLTRSEQRRGDRAAAIEGLYGELITFVDRLGRSAD